MEQAPNWLEQEQLRPYHKVASLFPLMEGPEFEELKADIQANGLIEPIWLHPDGSILDGRNRHRACLEAGIEPTFRTWDNHGSPVVFVVSLNLKRRDLNSGQRAVIALSVLPMLEEEAKERQRLAGGDKKSKYAESLMEFLPEAFQSEGTAREQAAQLFGTNGKYITYAKHLQEEAPDLLEEVKSGTSKMPKVMREYRKRKRQQRDRPESKPSDKQPFLIVAHAESMPQIGDASIDLIITSPPYNLGQEDWPMGGDGRQPRTNGIGYFDGMPEQEYQSWQLECLIEMYRVAKNGASLFYNHKVRNRGGQIIHPMDWLRDKRNPWIIRQEIIWDRGSTHNHSATLFWPHDERIYWMTKGNPTLPDRPIGLPTIWSFHGPQADTWHPAPFGEELPKHCIEAIGRDGITVLDPFAGSCTTLKVALEYGYIAIGVDVSREYLEQAARENGWTIPNAS